MTATLNDPETIDSHRTRTFIGAGIDPEKSMQLTELIRNAEESTSDPASLARKREALLESLIGLGLDRYSAFTSLYTDPSPHESPPADDSKEIDHAENA